jgi:hypothetical protein
MVYTHTIHVQAISLGIDHLVIKQSSSSGFHQEAVSLTGLTRLIYLSSPCQKETRGTGPKVQKNVLADGKELLTVPS